MSKKRVLSSGQVAVFLIILVSVVTVAVTFAFKSSNGKISPREFTETSPAGAGLKIDDSLSKVNLAVSNMSCSGCIATIKGSLASVEGIKDVLVDVAGGKAEVYYDSNVVKDVTVIANAITASGYPASVQSVLTAQQIREEKTLADTKSRYYVASVGGWDIARADLDIEVGVAKKRYAK
ncbi:MAG: heavy metal-associated domain-containing protein, partial [Pseudomonadota bacterium]